MKYIFVTVCYNFEKWIARCIRSAIDQNYKNWEMYVIEPKKRQMVTQE